MADARDLTYGVGFQASDALNAIEQMESGLGDVDEAVDRAEAGAQSCSRAISDMGAAGADAARDAGAAAQRMGADFDDAGDNASDSFRKMGAEADSFGAAFKKTMAAGIQSGQSLAKSFRTGVSGAIAYTQKQFTGFKNDVTKGAKAIGTAFTHPIQTIKGKLVQALNGAADAADDVEDEAKDAERALDDMGAAGADAARDAGDNASDSFRKMGAEADSFGAAFKKTMAAGIQSGQSLAKSFRTGVSGAIAYTQKQFTGFKNDVTKGAKAIGTAFTHPIQTIKGKLVQALNGAADAADDVEDEAKDAERALDDMGAEGSDAGNQVKDAIKGALAAFLSIEAIQAATDAIKEFASAAVEAAKLGENTSAKFDNLFAGTDVGEWADNYADAVHRSNTEVQGFLVSNQALYTNLGITDDAAAELSKTTTSLAYDFGNAFSMDDTEALTLIQEGIQGNGEALAEYGVKLDEATVKAQAMKMGLGDNIDEMDEATLAQVRLASIIEQSSKVQQAAITQTDGLTNSTKSLNGIWTNFMEDAGGKFTPVIEQFLNTIIEAWPTIEPMLLGLVEMLSEGLSQAMPVIMELGQALLPVLTDVLGTVFQAAVPLIEVFGNLAQTVLPPLASILGLLVETLMPPLTEILNVIISLIEPLMPVIQSIAEAILPPIAELLGLIAPILEALSPVLEVIGNVLGVIGDVLGTIIGWLADGVGAVVNFFSGLFGGAKDSKEEVEGLNGAVNGLQESANTEVSLAVDTSQYTSDVTGAATEANATAQESIIETKDITDLNLKTMGAEASSTYATMAIDAETAWSRMTAAAESGANAIVAAFNRIASAAASASSASVSVGVTSIPGNAEGTDNFEGGWTRINEEGGEVAFLPQGTAIIPADKSEQLIAGASSNINSSSSFSPSLTLQVQGNVDQGTADSLMAQAEAMFRRLYKEMREEEYDTMNIKNAYA